MEITEAKELLLWCKANGVTHIELDSLKADIIVDLPEVEDIPQNPLEMKTLDPAAQLLQVLQELKDGALT